MKNLRNGGPAEIMGIESGDRIIALNGVLLPTGGILRKYSRFT
ncbi:MAG: hypothetical protein Ct9H90mP30_2860 [Actinomycetota bacterium]|nr:MAG: hypothetical protein Ct9H90mP30_2860 [Actinomycetota bacterium]